MSDYYTKGDLGKLYNIPRTIVEYYLEIGLITPVGKSKRGYHLYNDDTVRRIRNIRLFQEMGFSLESIRLLLETGNDQTDIIKNYIEILQEKEKKITVSIGILGYALLAGVSAFDKIDYEELNKLLNSKIDMENIELTESTHKAVNALSHITNDSILSTLMKETDSDSKRLFLVTLFEQMGLKTKSDRSVLYLLLEGDGGYTTLIDKNYGKGTAKHISNIVRQHYKEEGDQNE